MSSTNGAGRSTDNGDDATAFLREASFSRGNAAGATAEAVTASDLFNASSFDPAKLHPMAQLGDSLDYLVLEDDKRHQLPGAETALPSRGWSDDLCYGTGTTYLSGRLSIYLNINVVSTIYGSDVLDPLGLALGGVWGLREGGTRPLAVSNARLRINSILNSVTRRGSFMGNSAGVLGVHHPFVRTQ